MTSGARRCDVLGPGGWRTLPGGLAGVRAGDVFRLFEPDGTPVEDAAGCRRWRAAAAAAAGPDGTVGVDADGVPETDVELIVREAGVFWPGGARPDGPRGRLR